MTKVLVVDCTTGEETLRDWTPDEEAVATQAASDHAKAEAAIAQARQQRTQDLATLQAALPAVPIDTLSRLMGNAPIKVTR